VAVMREIDGVFTLHAEGLRHSLAIVARYGPPQRLCEALWNELFVNSADAADRL
jgi:hypothetical protein